MSISVDQKRRGRPPTGVTPQIGLRLPDDLLDAVDAHRAHQDGSPSRSEAIRSILRDWLTGHGYLPHRDDPEGAN